MSDITNGKGGIISVTGTPQRIVIAEATNHKSAETLKVWNLGPSVVYAIVNAQLADYSEGDAIPIPVGGNFPFIGQPMKNLILACASGETSTANYGAY